MDRERDGFRFIRFDGHDLRQRLNSGQVAISRNDSHLIRAGIAWMDLERAISARAALDSRSRGHRYQYGHAAYGNTDIIVDADTDDWCAGACRLAGATGGSAENERCQYEAAHALIVAHAQPSR